VTKEYQTKTTGALDACRREAVGAAMGLQDAVDHQALVGHLELGELSCGPVGLVQG